MSDTAQIGAMKIRIRELDSMRGIAIILMVFFHLLVDLHDFFDIPVVYYQAPWYYVGKASAILFMIVSGISSSLSKNNLRRGAKIFLFGMVVTVATFFFVRPLYIRFGILHFMGTAIILNDLLDRLLIQLSTHTNGRTLMLIKVVFYSVAAPVSLLVGYFFNGMRTTNPFLFPIGLITDSFSTYDYYPLFPWIGVFFLGALAGTILTANIHRLPVRKFGPAERFLAFLGKKSLIIYILHQPLLMGILYLVFQVL